MVPSLYLINPRSLQNSYFTVDYDAQSGRAPMIPFAELSVVTVAGLVPQDMRVRICDEQVRDADPNPPEDFILLTGKANQIIRTFELARKYRALGKVVIIGGPYASLAPEVCRAECDILVVGELEDIAEQFFNDLRTGRYKDRYDGERADLRNAKVPRWDLYPNSHAASGAIQTTRGCPFSCEYCDVIQFAGRKQRHKSEDQIIAELNKLYQAGYRHVFIVDDNFTASRKFVKSTLQLLRDWNKENLQPVMFMAQMSMDSCQDKELLTLASEARLHRSFVGIETINRDSLKETRKFQNLRGSILDNTETFLRHGISIYSGVIFGFDADTLTTFDDQLEFLNSSPIPTFSAGALIAYRSTPLYRKMKEAGRIHEERGDACFRPWETNLVMKNMSEEDFRHAYFEFTRKVYGASAFERRVTRALELFGQDVPFIFELDGPVGSPIGSTWLPRVIQKIRSFGAEEAAMVDRLLKLASHQPLKFLILVEYLYGFAQARHMFHWLFADGADL